MNYITWYVLIHLISDVKLTGYLNNNYPEIYWTPTAHWTDGKYKQTVYPELFRAT